LQYDGVQIGVHGFDEVDLRAGDVSGPRIKESGHLNREELGLNKDQQTNQPRRILAIDGGGIKGTFPAAFLAAVEETIEQPIHKYFDLIVGTSTGGIIALGLGLGMTARDIEQFYETYGPRIFAGGRGWRAVRGIGWANTIASHWKHRCGRYSRRNDSVTADGAW
jgi:hypothetical protein